MTAQALEKLMDERDEVRNAALAIAQSDNFDPTDETFVDLQTRAEGYDSRVAAFSKLLESQQQADQLDGRLAKTRQREQQREVETRADAISIGESFIRSAEFRGYGGHGTSSRFEVDFDPVQQRALPTGISDLVAAGMKGAATTVDTTPPAAPTPLMNAVTQVAVSGNSIEYVAFRKVSGGATKVAEKAAKPSAEFGPAVTPAVLDTFAVYTQLTRQMIEDFAAVRSLIDNELRRDVARAEEADAAAVLAAAAGVIPDVTGDDLLSAIRVGIGTVEAAGYPATHVLLNPADWADMDVAVMGGGLGGPTRQQTFWGLTPISSSSQPAGESIVGSFASAVHHYYRSQIALMASDSHGDTFLANVITLLAERRSKTVVVRPQALVSAKAA